MGGVLRLRTRGGGRDFEPDELAGVAGTKKIVTALTITIYKQAPTHTLTAYRPQGDNAPYNNCQPSSNLAQLGALSAGKDNKKLIKQLKSLLKNWNIADSHTFALAVSNAIGAEPSAERVKSAKKATEISYYLNLPQYSLRIGLHSLNAENYKGVRNRPKNYGITFKDATAADTFRPNKDVDVKEYVYVYWTKERLKKIAEAILHLLENGEWDNDIAPADYVNPQQSKGSKGLGGVNDYYVLYDDDWNEIADFGRGKNLRTVKKEAKQILQSKNISEATLEIQDAWTGEIKDSITIDCYNARQKDENRVLYDYEREGGRDFDPEKKESTFEGIFNFWHNGKRTQRHNSDKRNDSGRISENSSRKTQKERDFRDIRCFENGLSDEQMRDFEQSERDLLRAASERIIKIAEQNNLFISPKQFYKFGGCKSKCTGESVVYTDGDTYIKVKDPFAKIAIKRTYATDVIYEHIIHNLLFPNTRYTFVGISEDCGDVRIILSQAAIDSYDRPTSKQITRYLKKVLGLENEGRYTWGNDYYAITDVGADSDNVLLGEDGELYFIDPLIKLKKRAKEVINYLLANQTSLSGVKRTATQTANHSALLRKHNIDLKRFEPFVSTDDLYPALQGVYFDPQGYLVASNSHVLIAEPAQIPQELSGKTINPKSQNECEGRFPDWRKAIPRAAQKTSEVDAARILQLADIVDRFEEVLGYEVFLRLFPERILFKHSYVRTVLDYARKYHNGQCRSYPNDSCRTHLLQAGDTQLLLCPMVPGAGNEYPDEIYTEPSSDGKITFHVCKQTNYRKWTSDSDYYQFVSDNLTIDELFCIALAHLRDYQLIDSHLRSLEWTCGGYHDLAYFNRRFNCWSNLVDVIRPLAKQPTAKEVDKRRAAYRKSVGPGYDSLTAAEAAFLYVCNDANCALLAPYIEQKPITVPRYGLMKPRFDLKMFTDCVAKDDRYGHRFDCVYISPQNFVRATNGRIFVDIAVLTHEVLTTPELQEKGLLVHPRSGIIEKGDYGNFDGIIASQWDNPVDANIGWDDISKALQAGGRKGLIRIDGGICLWGKDCAAALKMCSMFDFFRYAKFSVSKNNMLLVISAGLSRIIIAAALPADADCSIVDLTTTDRQRRLRLAQAKASAAAAVLALLKVRQNA